MLWMNPAKPVIAQSPATPTPTLTPTPTPTPTPLPRLENPTATLDCGFPVHGYWNDRFYTNNPNLDKPHTWTLTADCVLPAIADNSAWLHFTNQFTDPAQATFVIDGDGHTIYGPDAETSLIYIESAAKVALRDITIRGADYDHRCYQYSSSDWPDYPTGWGWWWCDSLVYVDGSVLDVRNLKIHSATGGPPFEVTQGSTATFKNLTVTGNTFISTFPAYAGIVSARDAGSEVTIDGVEFCNNQARYIVAVHNAKATLKGTWKIRGSNTYIYANQNTDPDDDVKRATNIKYRGGAGTISDIMRQTHCVQQSRSDAEEQAGEQAAVVCNPHCSHAERLALLQTTNDCFQRLGAIGVICRPWVDPEIPSIYVLKVDEQTSAGAYALGITQPEAMASGREGLVKSSADGRVGVYVVGPECTRRNAHGDKLQIVDVQCVSDKLEWLRGGGGNPLGWDYFLVVAKGPSKEGKTHVVYIDHAFSGHVIGTVDIFTGEPGIKTAASAIPGINGGASHSSLVAAPPAATSQPIAPFVSPQPANTDGSQSHVVRSGDTLHAIAVAYKVGFSELLSRNQLTNPNMIYEGQELVIRTAA